MSRTNVAAVVVTYNRKMLLRECLDAVLKQTYQVSRIILIDNASTDGTEEFLNENGYMDDTIMDYHLMSENLGGSGGFYEGLKVVRDSDNIDWAWIMDDDTVPTEDCLENLLKANEKIMGKKPSNQIDRNKISFLASVVYGAEGEFMNLPAISLRPSRNGYAYWYQYLNEGFVNIKNATFVSLLIAKDAIDKCGLPCLDYFIWGDDTEYTQRLTTFYGEAYLIGQSIAIHKRKNAKPIGIEQESDPKRIGMYVYFSRNGAINSMYYDGKSKAHIFIHAWRGFAGNAKKVGFTKAWILLKGQMRAVREYKQFKTYITGQLSTEVSKSRSS